MVVMLLTVSCKGDFIIDRASKPDIQEETISCDKCDYCYTCGLNFDGDYSCGMRYSCSCDGEQKAISETITYAGHYEKEPDITVYKHSKQIIKRLTDCK